MASTKEPDGAKPGTSFCWYLDYETTAAKLGYVNLPHGIDVTQNIYLYILGFTVFEADPMSASYILQNPSSLFRSPRQRYLLLGYSP